MKITHFFAVLAITLMAACCDKSMVRTNPFELDIPFVLVPGAQYNCLNGDISISFTRIVSDSRCPVDAECVWAGMVEAAIVVKIGNDVHNLTLASVGDNTSVSVGGYLVALGEVSPYPTLQNPIAQKDYRITLTVTQL